MLKHYDDRKGNRQSHEVYEDYYIGVVGYGDTKAEAFKNFEEAMCKYRDDIDLYLVHGMKMYNLEEVDCLGDILDMEELCK